MNSFSHLAQAYLNFIQYEAPKPVTIQTYETHKKRIEYLSRIWGSKDVQTLGREDINAIRTDMIKRGCKIRYVHAFLSVIRAFLRYCKEEKSLEVLDHRDIKLPPQTQQNVDFLQPHELEKFIAAINLKSLPGVRFMAFLTTLLDTGMRISEALSLHKNSIDPDSGSAFITGKGNKRRMVFFRPWSIAWLNQYLRLRQDTDEAMFVTCNKQQEATRMVPEDMRRYFRIYSKKAGIKRVTPHMIRRTGATYLRHNGADVHDIQKWLGHSRINITERYIGTDWNKVRESLDRFQSYGRLEGVGSMAKINLWTKDGKWLNCVSCGTVNRPHAAKGYCDACYVKKWRVKRREKPLTNTLIVDTIHLYGESTVEPTQSRNIPILEERDLIQEARQNV